jgi:hypothetical protein
MNMRTKNYNLLGLILITVFALSAAATAAAATPTMANMAGTYTSSTSGYTIVLYENGTGSFSGHIGTWDIKNATTIEGNYTIIAAPRTDEFTITSNGFTAVSSGNTYVKVADVTSTPTATQTPTTTPTAAPTTNPSVPEFSNAAAIIVAAAIVAVTLGAIGLTAKKRHATKS